MSERRTRILLFLAEPTTPDGREQGWGKWKEFRDEAEKEGSDRISNPYSPYYQGTLKILSWLVELDEEQLGKLRVNGYLQTPVVHT